MLRELQELSCHQCLLGVLGRHLGPAGEGEDFAVLARTMMREYKTAADHVASLAPTLKAHLFDVLQPPGAPTPEVPDELIVACRCLFNGRKLPETADSLSRKVDEWRDHKGRMKGAIDHGDDDDDLSPLATEECTRLMHLRLSVDLNNTAKFGAELLIRDEKETESERSKAEAAEALRAGAAHHLAVRTTAEDFYVQQMVRIGAGNMLNEDEMNPMGFKSQANNSALTESDVTDSFFSFEVERVDRLPAFIASRIMAQRQRSGGDGHTSEFGRASASALRGRRGFPPPTRQGESKTNSMVKAAERQMEQASERWEVTRRQQRMESASENLQSRDSMGQLTTDCASFLKSEQHEIVEEKGIECSFDISPALRNVIATRGRQGSQWNSFGFGRDKKNLDYAHLQKTRRSLPIYSFRDTIIETVKRCQVTVLVGETGSGKTTQLPQYLDEAGFGKNGIIGCTQPRRVAATSLAERVSAEMGCTLGQDVGYTVRHKDNTSPLTRIKYMTDGMLLREALFDDKFSRYSVLILDEAHERSLNTDVVLSIVRAAARERPSLRIIVTSATLDTEKFKEYFGCDDVLEIPGRTHPVDIQYEDSEVNDYFTAAVTKVMDIHLQMPPGDILVFFTGKDEIEQAYARLHALSTDTDMIEEGMPPMILCMMFAALPENNQSQVFEATPKDHRKVVLATNVAETSITIDSLYYVVDCGFCKQNVFDPRTNSQSLRIVPISQQQARQRAGRAGRTGPGRCYRLYTQQQFEDELSPTTIPEIQRIELANTVLTLKATGVDDLLQFGFIDPPPEETLLHALERLHYLAALDDAGNLTKLGSEMSKLPLDPSQSKTLLEAVKLNVAPTVLTIVAMLAGRGVFYRPGKSALDADSKKAKFDAREGDAATLLAVYDGWHEELPEDRDDWCRQHFVHGGALQEAHDTRQQLERLVLRKASEKNEVDIPAQRNMVKVCQALTSGYFFNAAKRLADGTYKTLGDSGKNSLTIHRSSSLANRTPGYIIYHELLTTHKEFIRTATAIDPRWLVELAPAFFTSPGPGRLTKEQMRERLQPKLKPWETGNDWRISRLKRR